MAVGAYTSAKITIELSHVVPPSLMPFIFLAALLLGGLLAALAGLTVGVPTLRLRGDYLAIVTLGFGEIIRVVLQNMDFRWRGQRIKRHSALYQFLLGLGVRSPHGLRRHVHREFHLWPWIHRRSRRRSGGKRDGHQSGALQSHRVCHRRIFRGHRGRGFTRTHKQFLSPTGFDFLKSIDIVMMVILGGMGRTVGVIIAAILLTLLPEFLRGFAEYRMIIYSLLVIVLMITRPQGLFSFGKWGRTKI